MEECEHKNKHQQKFDLYPGAFYWADVCNDCGKEIPNQVRMYVFPMGDVDVKSMRSTYPN